MTGMYLTNGDGICCGLFSCMAAQGLFDGVSREEKRALRQARAAERSFRVSKGYQREGLLERLRAKLSH